MVHSITQSANAKRVTMESSSSIQVETEDDTGFSKIGAIVLPDKLHNKLWYICDKTILTILLPTAATQVQAA
jgi:hypothetical protein